MLESRGICSRNFGSDVCFVRAGVVWRLSTLYNGRELFYDAFHRI
jgi:hypothetical protein